MQRISAIASHLITASPVADGSSRQTMLVEVPNGPLEQKHFAIDTIELEPLKAGKVRVDVQAVTIGAGQRAGLQGGATYAGASKGEGGTVMTGTGFGTVAESTDPDYPVGAPVMGGTGWREVADVPAAALTKLPDGVTAEVALGPLGTNGLTAYFGFLWVGLPKSVAEPPRPQPPQLVSHAGQQRRDVSDRSVCVVREGETVVVSAAGGSVGHVVCQLAKIKGCRVVGVAGSDEKCQRLIDELGWCDFVAFSSIFLDFLFIFPPFPLDFV